jgi:non-canonical poly(A) RNA polymerase PAPD5/7
MQKFKDEQHIYYNQAANVLEMEKRYEPILNNFNNKVTLALSQGQAIGIDASMGNMMPSSSRHNFFEIQNILHNEILLFKQDANAMLEEMQ